uniref:Ataxin-3 homolog n=2 Tax=Caenorhabditis japonica TaxID=281687 RepID=A0A8R1DEB4_CAEJA
MPEEPINSIFFEHQQAALCAQHALNMLLQDALFTSEDLRVLARQMDQMEHEILGNNANAIGHSENMNDSGFFSIQVIEKALDAFSLKLTNIENPVMADYKMNPLTARAYVCNLREHWFVLRKFGSQWFELNSINNGPRLLSDTFVTEFLHQLSAEGYTIFVVQGILPSSYADELISLCPVVPPPKKEQKEPNMVQKFFNSVGRRLGGSAENSDNREERDLAIAMAMSMEPNREQSEEEEQLKRAIAMSLGNSTSSETEPLKSSKASEDGKPELIETPILGNTKTPETGSTTPSPEQQRRDREKFLARLEQKKNEERK